MARLWFHTRVHDEGTPPTQTAPADPQAPGRAGLLGSVAMVLGVVVTAAASAWLVVSYQVARAFSVPIGVDTPSHLWRSRVVHALGMRGLFGSSPFEYHANSANPDRIGLPVLGSVFGSVVNVGPWRLMFIASALSAAVLAFAAWAVARATAEPKWAAPVYAAVVAVSLPFAVTARSHLDNALVDGLLVAAAAVAIRLARGEGGVWAGALLGTGAVVMHWPIGLLFVGVLGLYALTLVPPAVASHRTGTPWLATPAARVGFMTALSGGFGLGALAITPGAHVFSTAEREPFLSNLNRTLPWYRLPQTLPVAAMGAVLLWFQRPRPPRRHALWLYAAWTFPIAAGALLFALGRALPVVRLLAVALPIPLLCAAAGVGLIRLAASPRGIAGPVLAVVAAAVVLGGVGLQARTARDSFEGTQPMVRTLELGPIRAAIAYLTTSAPDERAVFVVQRADDAESDFGMIPAFRRIRAFAPGRYAARIATYLGAPRGFFAGVATHRPEVPGYDEASDIYWGLLRPWLPEDPVVMVLRPFYDGYHALAKAHPDAEIAPGVMLLRGPVPAPSFSPPPPLTPPSAQDLVRWIAVSFAALVVAGIGWSFGLLRLPWSDRLAFAPAIGLAALVIAGFVVGYGAALTRDTGRGMFAGVAVLGWLVGAARWAWIRRGPGRRAVQVVRS